ncbi:MAG: hypothetical protein SWN98_16690 [Pseudomonadota bacterium]|jgi:hypothetical protein|nr:hypothetical protein JT55_08600 [Rhodovulum sp. NI22]MDY6860964.1 hypothetical protein [Pseudomonadota bacterium]
MDIMPRATFFLFLCLLGSCARFPQITAAVGEGAKNAAFPTIQPMDAVLADAAQVQTDDETGARLAARAETLRRRARALGGPVLTRTERRRLLDAVSRHAL